MAERSAERTVEQAASPSAEAGENQGAADGRQPGESFRVAVASLDGLRINQHFGRSERFLIYRAEADGQAVLLEEREVRRPCGNGSHEQDALEAAAAALSDCSVALVSRIGPGADRELLRRGVKAFETPGELIPDSIAKLVRYLARLRGSADRG